MPTRFLIPASAETTVQRFDRASAIADCNPNHLSIETIDSGLLPQWEDPQTFFEVFDPLVA